MPDFIDNWWSGIGFELQLFYAIGILALVVLFFQMLLMLVFGLDDASDVGSMDVGDVGDHDSGLSIFSIKGITAFFVGFGWTGVICIKQGLSMPLAVLFAFLVGLAMMFAIFLMMKSFMRLQESGTLDYGNAIGQTGSIYVTVPPVQRSGGQVEVMIQGRLVTAEALQKGTLPIAPGTKVRIVERIGSSTLIVEPLV